MKRNANDFLVLKVIISQWGDLCKLDDLTEVYLLIALEAEVQDQGVDRYGFFPGSSALLLRPHTAFPLCVYAFVVFLLTRISVLLDLGPLTGLHLT